MEAEGSSGVKPGPARAWSFRIGAAFLPAVALALADVSWRVAFWLLGIMVDPTPSFPRTVEVYAPWNHAILTVGLAGWLLLRPGPLPALALGAAELLQAAGPALSLAVYARDQLSGGPVFGGPPDEGWTFYSPYGTRAGGDPWPTELLHLSLYLAAIVFLVVGLVRHRRAREAARRAAVLDAF